MSIRLVQKIKRLEQVRKQIIDIRAAETIKGSWADDDRGLRFETPVSMWVKPVRQLTRDRPNINIVNIYKNKNQIKMSITSGFRGKAAKKAHKLLDSKYDSLEKAILRVEFEGRAKVLATLQKQYQKEKLDLMAAIADGKIKEEDPAKKPATAAKKSVAKKAPAKKAAPAKGKTKTKAKGETEELVDPLS